MNDVLIIDDTPENLRVLVNILTGNGYQARPALSGELALKAVQEDIPGIILLDIMMPGMDGFEVCEKLKAVDRTKNIPVIFISALGDTEDKVKGFRAGGVDYISKPFQAAEVLARVKTHLANHTMHLQLENEIRVRRLAQDALQAAQAELEERVAQRTVELDNKSQRLEEANIALKILLEKREEDKQELEDSLMFNMEKLIFPYLERLNLTCEDDTQKNILEILRSNLEEIFSPFTQNRKDMFSQLTPTQVQVADLIKQGYRTKEIASFLNLSPTTVSNHRQEIRKRLSLTNKKINLQALLSSSPN